MIRAELRAKAGDLRQFASVRRITLDDGVEPGVRALAFSSGGGFDFWVLSDRSLDIGDGLMIAFTFCTDTLPYLQIWHDFRKHACVLGIEPCTSAKTNGVEKIMQPAETSRYEVNICFKSGQ
jgi:hypothetical protein